MKALLLIILGLTLQLLVSGAAQACIHPGGGARNHGVRLVQSGQQILVLHDGERQTMVLSLGFESDEPLPSLGWFIPVPEIPSDYGTIDEGVFDELKRMVRPRRESMNQVASARSAGSAPRSRPADPGFVTLPPAQAGPFEIVPILVTGSHGPENLIEWMERNGFHPIAKPLIEHYAERDWAFLAVRVEPPEGEGALQTRASLPALTMTFGAPQIVLPLKLLTHNGQFPLSVYVVSTHGHPLSAFEGALSRGFSIGRTSQEVAEARASLPPRTPVPISELLVNRATVSDLSGAQKFRELLSTSQVADSRELHVRFLHVQRFNSGRAVPERWSEDIRVPDLREGERLMGRASTGQGVPEVGSEGSIGGACGGGCATLGLLPPLGLSWLVLVLVRTRRG